MDLFYSLPLNILFEQTRIDGRIKYNNPNIKTKKGYLKRELSTKN